MRLTLALLGGFKSLVILQINKSSIKYPQLETLAEFI